MLWDWVVGGIWKFPLLWCFVCLFFILYFFSCFSLRFTRILRWVQISVQINRITQGLCKEILMHGPYIGPDIDNSFNAKNAYEIQIYRFGVAFTLIQCNHHLSSLLFLGVQFTFEQLQFSTLDNQCFLKGLLKIQCKAPILINPLEFGDYKNLCSKLR